eukprot:TRINITY_DN67531_c0_g1_i1.p1 TRINITY_DN67531_c0_g1~~TRINITY_DN67531_c0_g1_i1.p1  ORF type:complete len:218 (-),score=42.36 TRINITY_DN67531_c0_g1_i1:48-653(-)
MTVLGKSPCFVARDRNVTMRTALCGMIPGLVINIALWAWMIQTLLQISEPPPMVLHPGAKLEGSCLREYKFLRMMVFLTIATSLAALIYRPLGVRKPFSGKLTCCVVWLDTLLTLAIFCASVCGIAMTFSEPEEEHFVCTELYTLSSWFYLAFGVISFIMLVPAFFVVCCFGSAAHARETAAGAGDDEVIGYRKLLEEETQ